MITDSSTALPDFIRLLTRFAGGIGFDVPPRPTLTTTDLKLTPVNELRDRAVQIMIDGGDPFSDKKLMTEVARQQAAILLNVGPMMDQAALNQWWQSVMDSAPALMEAARKTWEQHAPTVERIAAEQGDFKYRDVRAAEGGTRAKAAMELVPALTALESAMSAWTYAQAAARGMYRVNYGNPALNACRGLEVELEQIDHAPPGQFFRDFLPESGSVLYSMVARGATLSLVEDEVEAQARLDELEAAYKRRDDQLREQSWMGRGR